MRSNFWFSSKVFVRLETATHAIGPNLTRVTLLDCVCDGSGLGVDTGIARVRQVSAIFRDVFGFRHHECAADSKTGNLTNQ